jgi:hypothetical protein
MRCKRSPSVPKSAGSEASNLADAAFPSALAGEDYDRYARSVWRQAERWLSRSAHRIARESIAMHEAREILSSIASQDLARPLHLQEERLLSELLQKEWTGLTRQPDDLRPEIPSFLMASSSKH